MIEEHSAPSTDVHPLAWRAILDGRPWVCTAAEAARLAELDRTFRLLGP